MKPKTIAPQSDLAARVLHLEKQMIAMQLVVRGIMDETEVVDDAGE